MGFLAIAPVYECNGSLSVSLVPTASFATSRSAGMKTLTVLLRSLGMVLLGTAPVMAASDIASDGGKVAISIPIPDGAALDDAYLNESVGGNPAVAVLVVVATRAAGRWIAKQIARRAAGVAAGAAWEAGNQAVKGELNAKKLACAADGGAIATGGVASAALGGAAAAACERYQRMPWSAPLITLLRADQGTTGYGRRSLRSSGTIVGDLGKVVSGPGRGILVW